MSIAGERIISGSFGKLYIGEEWVDNANSVNAVLNVVKNAVSVSGTRWQKHKVVAINGTGTISGFHVDSRWLRMSAWMAEDASPTGSTELISYLADPEAFGYERVRLIGVKFDSVQLANWTSGQEVTEEIPFTFDGYQLLDAIVR